jgi:hypothetical protein
MIPLPQWWKVKLMDKTSKYKLLRASSTVATCTSCKTWVDRWPDFMGEPFDKGYQCEKCGCTSVALRPGRPFGPKHKDWESIVYWWNEYSHQIEEEILLGIFDETSVRTLPEIHLSIPQVNPNQE